MDNPMVMPDSVPAPPITSAIAEVARQEPDPPDKGSMFEGHTLAYPAPSPKKEVVAVAKPAPKKAKKRYVPVSPEIVAQVMLWHTTETQSRGKPDVNRIVNKLGISRSSYYRIVRSNGQYTPLKRGGSKSKLQPENMRLLWRLLGANPSASISSLMRATQGSNFPKVSVATYRRRLDGCLLLYAPFCPPPPIPLPVLPLVAVSQCSVSMWGTLPLPKSQEEAGADPDPQVDPATAADGMSWVHAMFVLSTVDHRVLHTVVGEQISSEQIDTALTIAQDAAVDDEAQHQCAAYPYLAVVTERWLNLARDHLATPEKQALIAQTERLPPVDRVRERAGMTLEAMTVAAEDLKRIEGMPLYEALPPESPLYWL
ncbi:hypothetical protein KIPB_004282 [Kipferlia bialata]|uniref:Uncharacterized protein n=1 Tax=Kipferlia bialata TaxID=797122 RepID=A0A9K3CVS9_9EUKA|nr:hypothetical protein KIPB_004282 [Kipferlia bialata]|eukprot:g4282.t1